MDENKCCVPPEGADVDQALITTVERGHVKCVDSFLIDSGAHVNATDIRKETASLKATKYGHEECTVSLIKAEADVNMRNKGKKTPMILAAQKVMLRACNYSLKQEPM